MSRTGFSDDPADQANRFAIVVAALVVIFLALLVVLLAWGATAGGIARISDLAGYLRDHNNREAKVVLTLGAAVIVLLMLTVVIVEVTPSPIAKMRLRNVKAGDATITTAEIAARIETEARGVPHVRDCAAIVATHGRRIDVVLDLHVDEGADLAQAADAACARAQTLVEQQIGIALAGRPRARLYYRELRLRDGPPGPEAVPPASAATEWTAPPREDAEQDRGST
ncbi:MAG: hypothetical protein ACYC9X_07875 [Dehalococcoidia bacterium]